MKSNTILCLFYLLVTMATFFLNAVESQNKSPVPYQVMRYSDYKAFTDCDIFGYRRSLKAALNFLVFSEYHDGNEEDFRFNRDLLYTHRHSRQLFHDISKLKKCQQPSLMRMAKELEILDLKGNINQRTEVLKESSPRVELSDVEQYYVSLDTDKPVFEVLSRYDYIQTTGCLVSPSSYHKYHLAVFYGALDSFDLPKAKKNMEEFISDVAAGAHDKEGKIAEKCLTKSIQILAEDLGAL